MEKITQEQIAKMIGKKQSTVSKYLRGDRNISLIDASKVEPRLPIKIFIDAKLQKKYLGKVFLQCKNSKQSSNNTSIKE